MVSLPPRIMYENILEDSTIQATTFIPPYIAENVLSTLTHEYWKFEALSASLIAEMGNSKFVNCICIYGSGIEGTTITISSSNDGIGFEEVISNLIESDGAQMIFLDEAISFDFYKIAFSRDDLIETRIMNLMIGQYLEFERCLMKKHTPASYNRKTEYFERSTGEGQFLGRRKSRQSLKGSFDFQMISSGWARSEFQLFIEKALNEAAYVAWNPGLYPGESVFGLSDDDIPIEYTGDADLMSSNFNIKGLLIHE